MMKVQAECKLGTNRHCCNLQTPRLNPGGDFENARDRTMLIFAIRSRASDSLNKLRAEKIRLSQLHPQA
jgi:hypothetical protein